MRPLSFLFAALLGVVLSLIAPALAGPRPEAPLPESSTLAWASEAVAPEAESPEAQAAAIAATDTLAIEPVVEPVAGDEDLTVEQISRSILETINALSDAA